MCRWNSFFASVLALSFLQCSVSTEESEKHNCLEDEPFVVELKSAFLNPEESQLNSVYIKKEDLYRLLHISDGNDELVNMIQYMKDSTLNNLSNNINQFKSQINADDCWEIDSVVVPDNPFSNYSDGSIEVSPYDYVNSMYISCGDKQLRIKMIERIRGSYVLLPGADINCLNCN